MLPEKFKEKMQKILGNEYPDFINAIENGDAVRGMRVNLAKTSLEDLLSVCTLPFRKIPYTDSGFILNDPSPMGRSPLHHAGMIYMQDPGAMAPISAIDIKPDWWIADLCSAPGGKSSQAAERLGDGGFILSNEYVPKRAKIVVGNFERLGIKNAMVTSLDTSELAKMFEGCFDLVIVDAPCSGEGMFRKSDEAIEAWSDENVELCQARQKDILENAKGLVKAGGYLIYSTCTYSPEENEDNVIDFLHKNTDFSLIPAKQPLIDATSDGIVRDGSEGLNIELTRRFYPHISQGEGQYLALMKKRENPQEKPRILYKDSSKPLSKAENELVSDFFKTTLISTPEGRLARVGENIVLIPHGCPVPQHSVFMSGVLLGEIKGKTIIPSHQFFSVYGRLFKSRIDLSPSSEDIEKYLHGEEIDAPSDISGFTAVTVAGVPLGGGKASGGRLKNHYPKGLRNL